MRVKIRMLMIELVKAKRLFNLKKPRMTTLLNMENKVKSTNKDESLCERLKIIIVDMSRILSPKVIFSFKELFGSCSTIFCVYSLGF